MSVLLLILIGIAGGIIGGMGMGGGTLLIPLMTLLAGVEQHTAQAINLAAFIPMSAVALAVHLKNKLIDFKYLLWVALPAVAASAVAGPLASAAFGLMCDAAGSGMGTAGLVGVIQTFMVLIRGGMSWWLVTMGVLVCYIVVAAAVALGVSELMRKKNWLRYGDMLLPR